MLSADTKARLFGAVAVWLLIAGVVAIGAV
jgi:hypothetical protein